LSAKAASTCITSRDFLVPEFFPVLKQSAECPRRCVIVNVVLKVEAQFCKSRLIGVAAKWRGRMSTDLTDSAGDSLSRLLENKAFNGALNAISVLSSIASAVTLLSVFDNLVAIREEMRQFIDAWSAVVSPISRFLFGWIRDFIPFELPSAFEDYLVVGVLTGVSSTRAWLVAVSQNHAVAQSLPAIARLSKDLDEVQDKVVAFVRDKSKINDPDFEWARLELLGQLSDLAEDDLDWLRTYRGKLDSLGSLQVRGDTPSKIANHSKASGMSSSDTLKFYGGFFNERLGEWRRELNQRRRDIRKLAGEISFTPWYIFVFWILIPVWPVMISLIAVRAYRLKKSRVVFFLHSFGFVIAFILLVAMLYVFLYLP